MNVDIKLKWVAALRSGRYQQTSGQLRDAGGYCCLGVLCDVIDPNQWDSDGEHYLGAKTSLPSQVVETADVEDCNPEVSFTCPECDGTGYVAADESCVDCFGDGQTMWNLADINDSGCPFDQIAAAIEETLLMERDLLIRALAIRRLEQAHEDLTLCYDAAGIAATIEVRL